MAKLNSLCIFLCSIYVSLFAISIAQTCSNYPFPLNRYYKFCVDLPHHHAHIHWTYYPITEEIAIAYRARLPIRGWIAWGINPTMSGMIGTQALVAFRDMFNGNVTAYTTPILSYNPNMLPGDLSLTVSSISAELRNNEIIIYAVLGPLMFNITTFNHVWQAGYLGSNGVPVMHAIALPNLQSFGELDLLTWG